MTAAEREARRSFDNAAEIYNEIRPGYPADMFRDLFRLLPEEPDLLEVGPGTGQATVDLLRSGATVTAIEIGPHLARKLTQVVESDHLQVTVADFETVQLPLHNYDAVFAATAYHWISPGAQLDRPAQLLRRNGLLAVVDLNQVTSPDDNGFFAAAQVIYERYGEGHTGPPAPSREDVVPPILTALRGDGRFRGVELRRYDWNQTYSAEEYRKLMLSYSGTQMMEPDARRGLVDDMAAFVNEHFDGRITRPLVVTLTTGRPVSWP
jgi:SAM-dependent methyltransferase